MIAWVKNWIDRSLLGGVFASHRSVLRFAVRMTCSIVVLSVSVTAIAHVVLDQFGLLPYPLVPALVVGVLITFVLAGSIAFTALYITGLAIHQLWISRDAFERLSRIDTLSGLLNRRAFLEVFDRAPADTSLVLYDIDRFKAVNDTYGHEAGDRVIVAVAATLSALFGNEHVVSRMGGEEFAVLIFGLNPERRLALATRALDTIASTIIDLDQGHLQVTVSGGVAEQIDHQGFNALFSAADRGLYLAKASGRNRLVHANTLTGSGFEANDTQELRRA